MTRSTSENSRVDGVGPMEELSFDQDRVPSSIPTCNDARSHDSPVTPGLEEDALTIRGSPDPARVDSEKADVTLDFDNEKALGVPATNAEDTFPEGGKGWWVVFGSFLITFCTFGLVNSWVFQSLYQEVVLPNEDPSAIAWIGSLQYALTLLPGLVSGRLLDIGYLHGPLFVASTILSLSTILIAECTKFVHFLVNQGFVTGLACGFVFGPSMPIVSHWFRAKRSSGIGCVAAGAACGGTVLPIVIRRLIPVVGRQWTMRVVGLLLFVLLGLANFLIRCRLPAVYVSGGLVNPAAFKSAPYSIYIVGVFIGFLGMYTPLTFIDVSGVQTAHLSPDFSFYLVSIGNVSSLIGRVGGGVLSDKFGCLNMLVPFNLLAAIITFIWPYCTTKAGLIVVAVVYGAASGAFVGLLAAPVAYLGEPGDVGRRTGMMYSIVAAGSLIGPPISGAIYAKYGGFHQVGIYAGCSIVASAGLLFAAKYAAVGGWRGKF